MRKKRVVITGLGCICSIGNNVPQFWHNIKESTIGIDRIKAFDVSTFPVTTAAEVDIENNEDLKAAFKAFGYRNKGHFLGYYAVMEAFKDAGLHNNEKLTENTGISLGASSIYPSRESMAMASRFAATNKTWVDNIPEQEKRTKEEFLDDLILFNRNTDTIVRKIVKDLKLKGPAYTLQTACASSGNSIGNAYRSILHGEADIMITGGCDAMVNYLGMSAFIHLKALSTTRDPYRASIPFDVNRNGFVMGEGAGVIVLEERTHALKRGVPILGEITGYGTSNNAYRITDSSLDGKTIALSMERAIHDAGINKKEIGYICAHGTSTIQNDFTESTALRMVFGDLLDNIRINSIKHCVGHTISASGAISAINTILSIKEGCVTPMKNIERIDPECRLNIPRTLEYCDLNAAMVNTLGFGGQNVSLVFKKFE
ncbi:MAG: beta-ketoacyl-[acyl-carrier-protein] synthase family protein [Spirochaetales bacterium]|nr:beta-ketoacyl-[acyl-carrier-protein] synthase family protein [Spirochaetales bacterium]